MRTLPDYLIIALDMLRDSRVGSMKRGFAKTLLLESLFQYLAPEAH
jgi:hypothetical protein